MPAQQSPDSSGNRRAIRLSSDRELDSELNLKLELEELKTQKCNHKNDTKHEGAQREVEDEDESSASEASCWGFELWKEQPARAETLMLIEMTEVTTTDKRTLASGQGTTE